MQQWQSAGWLSRTCCKLTPLSLKTAGQSKACMHVMCLCVHDFPPTQPFTAMDVACNNMSQNLAVNPSIKNVTKSACGGVQLTPWP